MREDVTVAAKPTGGKKSRRGDPSGATGVRLAPDPHVRAGRAPRILVVDDDVGVLLLTRKILTRRGFEVECAETAMEALSKFRRFKPDLVLLDINLPKINGFEVCLRFREMTQEGRLESPLVPGAAVREDVIVLFLTGSHDPEDVRVAHDVGGQGYIVKPFDPEFLIKRIMEHLSK